MSDNVRMHTTDLAFTGGSLLAITWTWTGAVDVVKSVLGIIVLLLAIAIHMYRLRAIKRGMLEKKEEANG